jgi:hypothetical protein
MNSYSFVLLVLCMAAVTGIWVIAGMLQKALNEQIRALQAIYELLEKRQQRP